MKINFQQANNLKFPSKTLIDNLKIATFMVPVFPPFGIQIPGTVSISLEADLALTMFLEKAIDFKLSYSKHIVFALPFLYKNGKMNYPNPTNMVNVYGSQNLNPDFSQFKQIPKFGVVFTLTPGLTIRWPDLKLGKSAQIKPRPDFLAISKISASKRSILDTLKKFFQLVLTNQIPIIFTGGLQACSSKCEAPKPIEVSIQVSIESYQGVFSGLGLKKSFKIPITLTSPAFKFCLPFPNICPKSKDNSILKAFSKTCSNDPCKNNGKKTHPVTRGR